MLPSPWKVLSRLSQFKTPHLSSLSYWNFYPLCIFTGQNKWKSLRLSYGCNEVGHDGSLDLFFRIAWYTLLFYTRSGKFCCCYVAALTCRSRVLQCCHQLSIKQFYFSCVHVLREKIESRLKLNHLCINVKVTNIIGISYLFKVTIWSWNWLYGQEPL